MFQVVPLPIIRS